jgi:electron transfer flavoprotein beta subunit
MKALVLLSMGRHPVSGKRGPTRAEMQAARIAAGLDAQAGGLHAGPTVEPLREALGRGLTHLAHLRLDADADAVPALVAALPDLAPDVVFAGARGEGGEDSGLAPYAVAHALGWPLVADAVAVEETEGGLRVTQALPQGARRHVLVRPPVLVVVSSRALAPLPFAHGRARAGRIAEIDAGPSSLRSPAEGETRPYRQRPKAMSANAAPESKGRVLVDPDPHEAAREILAFLRQIGVFNSPGRRAPEDAMEGAGGRRRP